MAEFVRRSGVRVHTPPTLTVEDFDESGPVRGRRRRPVSDDDVLGLGDSDGPVPPDAVAASLADEFELVDVIPIAPTVEPTSVSGRRTRGAEPVPGRSPVAFDIDVAEGESAVVLVEQDGVYNWVTGTEAVAPSSGRRRGGPATRTLHFEVDAHARSDKRRPTLQRGFASDLVLRRMRAFVFRFAAGIVVGQVVRRLEREIHRGLVLVEGTDPAKWPDVEPEDVALPDDRPARILLLIHGTFSSTRGGFAGLGATPHGHEFLDRAHQVYDAIVGYDHRTLSEDPLENAEQVAAALARMATDRPVPHVDIVCHSRGALVSRALVELVLPELDPPPARIDRVAMVAGPNGGTALADPDNWKGFVDLYTNLAVAGTKALAAFAPPAATVALVLKEGLKVIAALVKAISVSAVDAARAPGLAAMDPGGAFVAELNLTQPLQPAPGTTDYYAVTSDFDVSLADPGTVTERLKRVLADTLVDELMDLQNDLVVDVPSMTHVDPHVAGYLTEVFDFGTNPSVFHTNYFLQELTVRVLRRWLGIDEPDGGGALMPGVPRVRPGDLVDELPAVVDQDFLGVDARWTVAQIRRMVRRRPAEYVVVRRDDAFSGTRYHYAFRRDELESVMKVVPDATPLEGVGILHETESSTERAPTAVHRLSEVDAAEPWTRRVVVLADGEVRGVVPHVTDEPVTMAIGGGGPVMLEPPPGVFAEEMPAESRATPRTTTTRKPAKRAPAKKATKKAAKEAAVRRGNVQRQQVARRSRPPAEETPPAPPPHHVRAEMPSAVAVDETVDVLVQVSTEEIAAAAAGAVASGVAADVDPARELVVTLVPRSGVVAVGEWQETLDPLTPGGHEVLLFQVKGVEAGPAELWVIVRQGPQSLLTLTLRSTVTDTAAPPAQRAKAEAVVQPPAPSACERRTLRIYETTAPTGELMLKFDLEMRDLGVSEHADSNPIKGDRDAYVAALYGSIEDGWTGSHGDVEVFTQRLRAIGTQILRGLVPPVIRDQLWTHREQIDQIEVISTEPQIPWEIVHLLPPGKSRKLPDEEQFLGMKGLVRWIHGAGIPSTQMGLDDVAAVVPEYPDGSGWELEATEHEWAFLSGQMAARRVQARTSVVLDLIGESGGFDVLHFAGHGEAESATIAHAALLMQDGVDDNGTWRPDRLTSTDVEGACDLWPEEGGGRPMVVLNACQVGRAGYQLTDIGGFARAFLHGGAGVFVGSLWAVGDEPASTFAQELYASLRSDADLSKAASTARKASRTADDATWLAYVVYGDPCAKVHDHNR